MHFPTLSVLTTFACAVFSVAAPLSAPPPATNVEDKLKDIVPRDTPGVPSTAVSPLVVALTGLCDALAPALEDVVKVVDGKVTAEIDTKQLKVTLLNVVAVVGSHVGNIKEAAGQSVENVQVQVVAKLLAHIISIVYTALETVASVQVLVEGVLNPIIHEITVQLAGVVAVVFATVPSVVTLVVTEVQPLLTTVVNLNLASIFRTLGVEAPLTS